ncbi:MAG TPA: hypothetical protein VL981_11160 [Candidatus Methylacidiphilales bacterium]|nr:hypothetical protein [Candidatus Methylacidiphilales bacterium]
MPPKAQTPPPLKTASSDQSMEDRILKTNPEIDRRLDAFMQANTRLTDYYTKLVNENPERAVRSFMLSKMMRHESEQRTATRLAPQAKEWLEKQSPEVQQRIHEKIEKYSPMYREKAAVRIIGQEKARLDFRPKESVAQGLGASV